VRKQVYPGHEEVVEDAVDVVVHEPPHLGRNYRGDGPRNEHCRPHCAPTREVRADNQGDAHAQQQLENHCDQREGDGDQDRVMERVVSQQVGIVLQSDELNGTVAGQAFVCEARKKRLG